MIRFQHLSIKSKFNTFRLCSNLSSQPIPNPQTIITPKSSSLITKTPCRLYDFSNHPIPYHQAWEWQHTIFDAMRKHPNLPDAIILLEHEPVYTLGSSSELENVLFDAEQLKRGQTQQSKHTPLLVRTERGGEVTYHGPGQLVAYPILNLSRHKKDLHWYLRSLEEVVILMLKQNYNLDAGRKDGLTGVWVNDTKICAMGLKVSKWITMHGLALNICMDLSPFQRIIPCGISDYQVSSLDLLTDKAVTMCQARIQLLEAFSQVFGPYQLQPSTLE